MRQALRRLEIISAELQRDMLNFLAWTYGFRNFQKPDLKVARWKAIYPRAAGGQQLQPQYMVSFKCRIMHLHPRAQQMAISQGTCCQRLGPSKLSGVHILIEPPVITGRGTDRLTDAEVFAHTSLVFRLRKGISM